MLPPGHIAAGYLTSKFILGSLHYTFTPTEIRQLIGWGMLFSIIPDLDMFLAFAKLGKFRIENDKVNHRKLVSHAPILWLSAGVIIFFAASSPYYKALGILLWLCSWSHFILDSEWGIMWLWPASKKLYPFSAAYYQRKYAAPRRQSESSLKYWSYLVIDYLKQPSGWLEILLILIALSTALK